MRVWRTIGDWRLGIGRQKIHKNVEKMTQYLHVSFFFRTFAAAKVIKPFPLAIYPPDGDTLQQQR